MVSNSTQDSYFCNLLIQIQSEPGIMSINYMLFTCFLIEIQSLFRILNYIGKPKIILLDNLKINLKLILPMQHADDSYKSNM